MKEESKLKVVFEKLREFHKERKTYDKDYELNIDWYEELFSLVREERKVQFVRFLEEVSIDNVDNIFLSLDLTLNI